jgi:hypothetical protein
VCRQDVVKQQENTILQKLPGMVKDDSVSKETLVLYLHYWSQGIMDHVPAMYKSLILYNTRLLIDHFDDPVDYIIRHKLIDLLKYHDYTDYEDTILELDDVDFIPCIKVGTDTLYNIVKYGSLNLLTHYKNDIVIGQKYIEKKYKHVLYDFNLLGIACLYGKHALLPLLLDYFDINVVNKWNCTVLYAAIASGNMSTVKLLVDHGIDINMTHSCGNSPLYYAIETHNYSIAHYLINKGAKIEYHLIRACMRMSDNTNIHIGKRIVQLSPPDSDTNLSNFCDNSKFPHIDGCKKCSCAECAVKNGQCDIVRPTLLQSACLAQHFELIVLLLSHDPTLISAKCLACTHTGVHLNYLEKRRDEAHVPEWIVNTQSILSSDFKSLLFNNLKHDEFKPVCDYILKLIRRGGPYSYKHQRRILSRLVLTANREIFNNSRQRLRDLMNRHIPD